MAHVETTDGSETVGTSISLETPLLAAGRKRAKERRQSFSAYVSLLIERDVKRVKGSARPSERMEKSEVAA